MTDENKEILIEELVEEVLQNKIAKMEIEKPQDMRRVTCPFSNEICVLRGVPEEIKGVKKMLWGVVVMLLGTLISISMNNPSPYYSIKEFLKGLF